MNFCIIRNVAEIRSQKYTIFRAHWPHLSSINPSWADDDGRMMGVGAGNHEGRSTVSAQLTHSCTVGGGPARRLPQKGMSQVA